MNPRRLRIALRGAVQGVGFRPFVYRLAGEMGLPGWVLNSPAGVFIEIEGAEAALDEFLLRLQREKPPRSSIQSLEFSFLDPAGFAGFEIRPSEEGGATVALVLPDIATCPECVGEIFDSSNRRYLYPFTNCTNCGPRFSIIEGLPYDRPATTMRFFEMCPACRREYEDPLDRRFHAQPIACPECGPRLDLWDRDGEPQATHHEALLAAAAALRDGLVVAVKGLGGFHLMVDATNEDAVRRLRERKHREEKPLAVMFPSLKAVRAECEVSAFEERLLLSPESPIVLLDRRGGAGRVTGAAGPGRGAFVVAAVAPGNPSLGVMLPYTPLHHLLLREVDRPLVATSGNLSEEPICTDERDALARLGGIADLFLVHNRPIARHVDDSIVRVMLGRELVLRRARGYAPLPVTLRKPIPPVLAVGGHLKNTVAVTAGENVFLSQHIGDLENEETLRAFNEVVCSLRTLYRLGPERIAADLHPDYMSTKFAAAQGAPVVSVQHHHAHVAACMAENELEGTVLGVSWDGTGYGTDGTVWGGEFLLADERGFERVACLRPFRLPGGEAAVREPRRSALGVLHEIFGDALFDRADLPPLRAFGPGELPVLRQMLERGLNAPVTTSAGRLFDAAASILGFRQRCSFEGQAAMELEFAARAAGGDEVLAMGVVERQTTDAGAGPGQAAGTPGAPATPPPAAPDAPATARVPRAPDAPRFILDWEPLAHALLDGVSRGRPPEAQAAAFHNALAEGILEMARRVGQERVALTGGCFQNRVLTERAVARLQAGGFRVYWHQRVPPNDGGIALGQAVVAGARNL